ncbi:MAG: choice-of-anchor D domain-containing protein [Luteolibacter sp.]
MRWRRAGTATWIRQVTFDLSTDSGATWTPLGAGTRTSSGWELSGQSLPASGMLRARGRTSGGQFNGSEGIFEQVANFPSPPLLANLTSSGITEESAILGSNITYNGGLGITERGIVYARTEDNASPVIGGSGVTTVIAGVTSTGVFTQLVTGLALGTDYTFRAYAKSSEGTGYSGIQNFTTLDVPTVIEPTSSAPVPLANERFQITLGGNIISDNGLPVTERGVVYSTRNIFPELGQSSVKSVVVTGTSLGVFTTIVGDLSSGSTYYFRAYAKNAAGVAYSPRVTITTPDVPSVRTLLGLYIGDSGVKMGGVYFGRGDADVTNIFVARAGVEYGKVPDDARLQTIEQSTGYTTVYLITQINEDFFENLSAAGLEPGRYGYRAFVENDYTKRAGEIIYFNVNDRGEVSYSVVKPEPEPELNAAYRVAAPVEDPSASAFSAPPEAGYDPDVPTGFVQALAVQPDGKTIIAGQFDTVGGVEHQSLARLNADGSMDASFTPVTDGIIYSVVVQEDGKILLGGAFTQVNEESRGGIARLNADGTLESIATFNPGTGADNIVYSVVLQPDGKILLGGLFDNIQSTPRNGIARLNADGGVDGTFDPGTGADDAVYSVALQTDGKILIGGAFQNVAGTARNHIARLDADGGLDATFAPVSGADDKVDCVIVQPDGKILIGGYFTTVNGTSRNRIARLSTTGALDGSFDPGTGADGVVYTMSLQTDGKVMLGGDFQNVNDTPRSRIARLNANGGLDISFDPGSGTDAEVDGIALQADGNILFAGGFTLFDGVARNRIARIGNDAVTQSVTVTNATQAQWMRSGAGPEVSSVAFQLSTDGGVTWAMVGSGTRIAGGWQGSGLSLPPGGTLRGVGRTSGGFLAASSGLVAESAVFALDPGDILVEQPAGSSLASGGIRDFGAALLNDNSQRTFTVSNTGSGHLAGVMPNIAGPHAGEFTLDTLPDASLSPSGSTTFLVRFTPTSLGAKTALLSIFSNDPDESPFSIRLTGAGAAPLGIWRQTHFNSTSNSDIGGDLYDFDGDGLANVLEYAFDQNPILAGSNQLPKPQMGGGNVFFDFTQPATVSGVIYGAEWSTTLKAGEWTNIPDTGTPPQHLFTVPTTGDKTKFLRLKVTSP